MSSYSLHRPVLPEDDYDGGVKKPVAVPKIRKVPSGRVWEKSKLQVTRSPCTSGWDLAAVRCVGSPPVGVKTGR
jgi:hypothetical protein